MIFFSKFITVYFVFFILSYIPFTISKKLDAIEERLLDKIILGFHAQQSLLVGDLISLSELGSQATLHGRLKNLSAMGYIKMAANEDGRKKEVVPTKIAIKRYEEISKCLEKAVKAG
jgi:DNA-binding MarR family transcriptional regulator